MRKIAAALLVLVSWALMAPTGGTGGGFAASGTKGLAGLTAVYQTT